MVQCGLDEETTKGEEDFSHKKRKKKNLTGIIMHTARSHSCGTQFTHRVPRHNMPLKVPYSIFQFKTLPLDGDQVQFVFFLTEMIPTLKGVTTVSWL